MRRLPPRPRLDLFNRADTIRADQANDRIIVNTNDRAITNTGTETGSACCCCFNQPCEFCPGGVAADSARITFAGFSVPTCVIPSCRSTSPEVQFAWHIPSFPIGSYCIPGGLGCLYSAVANPLLPAYFQFSLFNDDCMGTDGPAGESDAVISLIRTDSMTWTLDVLGPGLSEPFGDCDPGSVSPWYFHGTFTSSNCSDSFTVDNELPAVGSCVHYPDMTPWTYVGFSDCSFAIVANSGGSALVEFCCL